MALELCRRTGLFHLGRRLHRRHVPVLTYHHVVPGACVSGLSDAISVEEFEHHLAYLTKHYSIITGGQFRAFLRGTGQLPAGAVLLTFDDGYRNNFEHAFPALQRIGATAIFFLTSDFVGEPRRRLWFERFDRLMEILPAKTVSRWFQEPGRPETCDRHGLRRWLKSAPPEEREATLSELHALLPRDAASEPRPETAPMSWDDARRMAAAGMTIGAHTATHQILSAAATDVVRRELASSRERIESELGAECWAFSYPNGSSADFRTEDCEAVARAGFSCAFTQIAGFVSAGSDPFRLPRLSVPTAPDFDSFVSRLTGVHHAATTVTQITARALSSSA
jgi:peptidoglycan/xylan/chitin deacetylase (PgdA/CDA1 family)